MKYSKVIMIFCLLAIASQGAIAWGSLRSNNVHGLENTYAPSHDYILKQSYYNLEIDPAFVGSNFPSIEAILNNEGLYADEIGRLIGGGPDLIMSDSKHVYNPITNKGTASLEASKCYNSLKKDLLAHDTTYIAKDAAWLAHYMADITCPFHINGMPPEEVSPNNPLTLPMEDIGYPLPITTKGMGRITNSLNQNENLNARLIQGIPADAPIRGRGWYDNKMNNWYHEYSHFMELRAQDKDGKHDWFDPWGYDGTYKYTANYIIKSYTRELVKESSTHALWEWYAYWNYSRPDHPLTQVKYSPVFLNIQQSRGNGVNGNIEEFVKKIAANTLSSQQELLDESVSGRNNLDINSKLGEAYQETIRDIYTVWRASFSALRLSVLIEPISKGDNGQLTQRVELKIKNVANESAKNVRIIANTDSSVWTISPTVFDNPGEIPAGNEISNAFLLAGINTSSLNEFNISFTVTGNYQDVPDSGFTRITTNVKTHPSVISATKGRI